MKKILFLILINLLIIPSVNAQINDVEFVGGTGGSKIIEVDINDNSVDTKGVIYNKEASLVYKVTYTNSSNTNKVVSDLKLPENSKLNYYFDDISKGMVIKAGETINFRYSITADDNINLDELSLLAESAKAELLIDNEVINPNTLDKVFLAFIIIVMAIVLLLMLRRKEFFYASFVLMILFTSIIKVDRVTADDDRVIFINTLVEYELSNMAPSCANLNYVESNPDGFCVDWPTYGSRDTVNYMVTTDSKDMTDTYQIGDVTFELVNTYDVSEQQNEKVILGKYKAEGEKESYLYLIGQDGGVVMPVDASYQFSSYNKETNKSDGDFWYVGYVDFSKFFSNKTTNMSNMLTGLGADVKIEKYDLSGFETSNVTDMSYMFTGIGSNNEKLNIDLSHFDTSNVTNMIGL